MSKGADGAAPAASRAAREGTELGASTGARPALLASWRPSARLDPVERYDRFEILGRIGRGGMAEILLARERSIAGGARHLVIKRVLPEARDLDDMLHMFLDEARVVMGLSHPNLCQIYEIGEHDGAWFIAMEWVNGVTLSQLIRRALDTNDVDHGVLARVFAQCAEALHYAHTARDVDGALMHLVHRDVSPHNVMIAYDGRVKLLDFGIAKSSTTTHKTEAGVVKGKVCYMAPEQWLSQPLDGRTDVFALGACLYEALSGRVVFKREGQSEVMKAALAGDVPKLWDVVPHVPRALAEVAHRALETLPERRFQSAREMGEALERYLATLPEPVGAARISAYTRRLFHAEVQLGPLLERSVRGAQLARSEGLLLPPLLPPLLPSFLDGPRPPSGTRELPAPMAVGPLPSAPEPALERRSIREDETFECEVVADDDPTRLAGRGGLALTPSEREAETQLAVPAAIPDLQPLPPSAAPRPLARTLSMRVVWRTRWAAVAASLVVAALVPLVLSRVAPRVPSEPAPLALHAPEPAPARVGALSSAPPFTMLAPSTPLAGAPSARPGTSRTAPADPRGLLSINTRPWSTVYLGRRLLGSTPLAQVPVPRHALVLKMVDRDGRVHVRRIAAAKSERPRTVYFEFEPPKR